MIAFNGLIYTSTQSAFFVMVTFNDKKHIDFLTLFAQLLNTLSKLNLYNVATYPIRVGTQGTVPCVPLGYYFPSTLMPHSVERTITPSSYT